MPPLDGRSAGSSDSDLSQLLMEDEGQLLSRTTALTCFVSLRFPFCVDGMFCALRTKVLTTDLNLRSSTVYLILQYIFSI